MKTDPIEQILVRVDRPIAPRTHFAAALLERLLEDLVVGHETVTTAKEDRMIGSLSVVNPSTHDPQPLPREVAPTERVFSWQRPFVHLATAAIVLLTIGTAFVTFREQNFGGMIATNAGVTHELIVGAEVLEFPQSSVGSWTGIERATLAPGVSFNFNSPGDGLDGVFLFLVESGEIEFTVDGPASIIAAGDPAEKVKPVEPGTTVTLMPGDRGIALPGVDAHWRNSGSVTATILDASVSKLLDSTLPDGFVWTSLIDSMGRDFPATPATFELHRVTMESGAEMPVSELPGLSMAYVESGAIQAPLGTTEAPRTREFAAGDGLDALVWELRADGSLKNDGPEPAVMFVFSIVESELSATPSS